MHGDARLHSILRMAGAEHAKAIIVTAAGAPAAEISAAARDVNPKIAVLAHTTYMRNARNMRKQGAQMVVSGEEEVALTLSSMLLRGLGATEEQIQKARVENREKLTGTPQHALVNILE